MPRRSETRQKPARNMALDGLRAFAIIAVVLYHLSVSWLPSGHMGVVVFLVLTGYLASSTVIRTMRRDGGVSLPRLWFKRVVRIWPPMAIMIAFVVALCVVFNHVLLTKMRPDIIPSLLLSNNIGAILRGASYFDKLGGISPITHLWYLGVDFQFFIIWTLVTTLTCPRGRPSRMGRRIALVLALVSAILMAVFYDPNADPTRVYYGPDTRAFAPLLGAWLGLAWPLGSRPVRLTASRTTVRSFPLVLIGPLSLAGIIAIMVLVPDTSPFLFRGGMLLVSVLSVLVIAGLLERRTPMSRVFALPPIVWLGTRSYGLYLWHFPLFQLFKVTNNATPPAMIVLALALSLIAAELSYRLVEQKLSQNLIPLILDDQMFVYGGTARLVSLVPALLLAVGIAVGGIGLAVVGEETAVPESAIRSTGVGAAEARDLSAEKNASSSASSSSSSSSSSSVKQSSDNLPEGSITLKSSDETIKKNIYIPTVIADSVAGDADWYFKEHVPDGLLDSYIGRRPDQALQVLEGYIDQGVVGDIVILDSFSNVPATDDTMKQLIEACGNRKVYLVNVRIPESEQEQINEQISRFAKKYDNVTLIDWYGYSEGHPDWIYPDGEHLTPEGQPYYIDLITNAIAKDFVESGGTVTESKKSSGSTSTSSSTDVTTESSSSTSDSSSSKSSTSSGSDSSSSSSSSSSASSSGSSSSKSATLGNAGA